MAEVAQAPTSQNGRHDSTDQHHKSTPIKESNGLSVANESQSPTRAHDTDGADGSTPKSKSSKKRRKVNHACVYCRRSHMTCDQERPCSRCIKRNIGHLCHDEPREHKKSKTDNGTRAKSSEDHVRRESADASTFAAPDLGHADVGVNLGQTQPSQPVSAAGQPQLPQPVNNQPQTLNHDQQPFLGYNDWNNTAQNPAMRNFQPNYMFNTSEASNEYNLLNDFLSTSILDDAFYTGDSNQGLFSDPSFSNIMGPLATPHNNLFATSPQQKPLGLQQQAGEGSSNKPDGSGIHNREKENAYFLTAADPAGNGDGDYRMNELFRAKHEAGLLKPWDYVKGYERLYKWMRTHIQNSSRTRLTRQIERFRPEFRKRIQQLQDFDLVLVEIWFERKLMEYDRIFASMPIPACCWRRTGEIFRGNREMAELINISPEQLRDGKMGLYEILTEDSLVLYWERFTAIAFDTTQKAILTRCTLRHPTETAGSNATELPCAFSFTVFRDTHNVPALIVGNFLPVPNGAQHD